MSEKPYRRNVGMVVFNKNGEGLVGDRFQFPGTWQFPQGGIDPDEDYIDAAKRELLEEVGIEDAVYVGEYPDWIAYDFPPNLGLNPHLQKYRGQLQRWILYYWNQPVSKCRLDLHEQEFRSVNWMPLSQIVERVVPFKRPVYEKIIPFFMELIRNFKVPGN